VSDWFQAQIVHPGRLPLFCFFVAFIVGFGFIRLSVRLIRAQVRWWPGNISAGDTHVHHVVFGVVLMSIGGVAGIAAPASPVPWRAVPAAVFGLGTALVLDEFALVLHLRDVYWSNEGRLSVDAVFVAAGVTCLLLLGVTPAGVGAVLPRTAGAAAELVVTVVVLFCLATVTLLKGKFWTGMFGLFVPLLFFVGALRLARPNSPWARWRYRGRPAKSAKAYRRDRRLRAPAIRWKNRIQDLLAGGPSPLPHAGRSRRSPAHSVWNVPAVSVRR